MPCCCDPGQCPCYICVNLNTAIEDTSPLRLFSIKIFGFIAVGLLAACFGGVTVWKIGGSQLNRNQVYAAPGQLRPIVRTNRFFGGESKGTSSGTRKEAELRDISDIVAERKALWAEKTASAESRTRPLTGRDVDDVVLADVDDMDHDHRELGRADQNDI